MARPLAPRAAVLTACRRWTRLVLWGCGGLLATAGAAEPAPARWLAGADISALPTFERHGATYRSGRTPGDALALLRARGVDCFRLRLFVAPNGEGVVNNDLAYTIALAQRVRRSGARLLLDLHYSDTWADPAKQFKPAAWAAQPLPELAATVRTYTAEVFRAFAAAGVAPDYVQLGNEITNGLLWPDGQVEFSRPDDTAAWDRLGTLLRAAHAGLVDAYPHTPPSILHLESPHQLERALWFCVRLPPSGCPSLGSA